MPDGRDDYVPLGMWVIVLSAIGGGAAVAYGLFLLLSKITVIFATVP